MWLDDLLECAFVSILSLICLSALISHYDKVRRARSQYRDAPKNIWAFSPLFFIVFVGAVRNQDLPQRQRLRNSLLAGPVDTEEWSAALQRFPPLPSFEFGVPECDERIRRKPEGTTYTVVFPHLPEDTIANQFSFEIVDQTLIHAFLYTDLTKSEEGYSEYWACPKRLFTRLVV